MPQNSQKSLLESIDDYLRSVDTAIKQANTKKADECAVKDPGGYTGKSTHPSADVEGYVQEGRTGARAAENEKDVKEDHPGGGVDNTDEGSGGSEDDHMMHVGMKPSSTGDDPEHEDAYKKEEKDPGTTQPSGHVEDQGSKYASMRFPQLCKTASDLANQILADFANGYAFSAKEANVPDGKPFPPKKVEKHENKAEERFETKADEKAEGMKTEQEKAAQAGYNLADELAMLKQAEETQNRALIEQTIKDAEFDAMLVKNFYDGYFAEKAAAEKKADPDRDAGGVDPTQDPNMPMVAPPSGAGADAGGAAEADAATDAGGPAMDAAGAGPSPDMAGMAGPDAGAGGTPGGEQISQEQALQAISDVLRDLNIDPAELAQLVQQGPAPQEGAKLASAVSSYRKTGLDKKSAPKTANERKLRSNMHSYISELIGY